ncbi:hypothetical protein TRFO_33706 [Tritrichomonas foetus]|uniref:Uncharacterized protein n=1 Tax=Tritrichomonas foetus TaxID=1144522 RepID=A0A1J4JM66_9EUKA|nr:hypothetical protein TRFO_33706 [Tritrichomonas foetus]|eukprot:OHS99785.1 hypothetical protein TRFO_33706 [Tritrichomonas foetus]
MIYLKKKNPIDIEFNRFSYHYNEDTAQKQIQRNTTGAKNSLFETSLEWNQTTTTDKFIFNNKSFIPEITSSLNHFLTSESNNIYYRPKSATRPGYDSAIKIKKGRKTSLFILQMTISESHSFHMNSFEELQQYTLSHKWNIEFWMVLPKMCQLRISKIKISQKDQTAQTATQEENEQLFCKYTQNTPFIVAVPNMNIIINSKKLKHHLKQTAKRDYS